MVMGNADGLHLRVGTTAPIRVRRGYASTPTLLSARLAPPSCDTLLETYKALDPTEVHAARAPAHLPSDPGFACDIGACSGRATNWLAAQGWEVVAVESSNLRDRATRNSHQHVVWMNDSCPDQRNLRVLGRRFELILFSAVWMHVAPNGREQAFRIPSEPLGPSGLLVITRHRAGMPLKKPPAVFTTCPRTS